MTTGQPASGGPSLSNVDAIFFMWHREVDLDDKQKADLLKFVHDDGKGFVAAHVGLTALMSWPEFGEMLGGQFAAVMSRTADLFREQPAVEQRKLLRLLVSEASWKGGELRMSLNEPFERLRLSNSASFRNHKGFDAKTPDFDIWRRGGDSNPR